MPDEKTTTTTPSVPLTERLTQLKVALGALINPTELLELFMQVLSQELLVACSQGQPLKDNLPLLDRLMRYEALRLRRESLSLRQRKAKSSDYFPEEEAKPIGAPDPAPPEVVEYVNAIRRKMWGTLPEDAPQPDPVTSPPTEAETATQEEPAPIAESASETVPSAEVATAADKAAIRARIEFLEKENAQLAQEAEDRWLRIQTIEAKQKAEQLAAYDPRPFRDHLKRRRRKYDGL
jgi:hypothetical protein